MTAQITTTDFQRYLESVNACGEAREWAGNRTAEESWGECERADWLLWWAAKAGVDRKLLVRCACQCARRALKYVPDGELRPLRAIETAEAWCEGKATLKEVRDAAYAVPIASVCGASAIAVAYAVKAASESAVNDGYAHYAAIYAANADYAAYVDEAAAYLAMCAIVRQICP